jgi:hypothetical protein
MATRPRRLPSGTTRGDEAAEAADLATRGAQGRKRKVRIFVSQRRASWSRRSEPDRDAGTAGVAGLAGLAAPPALGGEEPKALGVAQEVEEHPAQGAAE